MINHLEIVTAPAFYPVSLVEAKRWLRIDDSDTNHDAVVTLLIAALTTYAENRTLRAFVPRTYRLNLDSWLYECGPYGYRIVLPYPPLYLVDGITYLDTDGTRLTLDTALYDIYTTTEPAYVLQAYASLWPTVRMRPSSVQITYRAGYTASPLSEGDVQAMLPVNLKLWMQARIATLFENREQIIVGTIVTPLQHDFSDGLIDDLIVGTRMF